MKKHNCLIMTILLLAGIRSFSQENAPLIEKQICLQTSFSAAVQVTSVASALLMNESYFPLLFDGLCLIQNSASAFVDADKYFPKLGTQILMDGLQLGNAEVAKVSELQPLLFNLPHKYSMYWTYDTYSSLREQLSDETGDSYKRYSLGELLTSPFELESYESWYVWGYVGGFAVYQLASLLGADQAKAIWTTGKSYVGDKEFPLYLGIPLILALQIPNFCVTGIGEESLYRGVYYEEMKRTLGLWPAKTIDALYFTASHLPQKIAMGDSFDANKEIVGSLLSIGQTLWLQHIYDRAGLKAVIAAHAASDVVIFFLDWMLQAGVPNSAGFSINDRELNITIRM